jgi:hypothetical protein
MRAASASSSPELWRREFLVALRFGAGPETRTTAGRETGATFRLSQNHAVSAPFILCDYDGELILLGSARNPESATKGRVKSLPAEWR